MTDRPAGDLDGLVEPAVCGAIVQIWGSQRWDRMYTGRTACPECVRLTAADAAPDGPDGAEHPESRLAPLLRVV